MVRRAFPAERRAARGGGGTSRPSWDARGFGERASGRREGARTPRLADADARGAAARSGAEKLSVCPCLN
jgi:hypothetical protein